MPELGTNTGSAKYAVNPSTGEVMRNDGSGWAKVKSAKNPSTGEIMINEGAGWGAVPKASPALRSSVPSMPAYGAQARATLDRGEQLSPDMIGKLSQTNFQPLTPEQQITAESPQRIGQINEFDAGRAREDSLSRLPDSNADEHAMMLMNGATIGNGPRMYAAAKTVGDVAGYPLIKGKQALLGGDGYSNFEARGISGTMQRHLEDGRTIQARAREERPGMSLAEEVVPSVLNGKSALEALTKGVKNKYLAGAMIGGPLTGLYMGSQNESGDIGEVARDAAIGTGIGVVATPAVMAGGSGLAAVARPPARAAIGAGAKMVDVIGNLFGKDAGATLAHNERVAVEAVKRSMKRSNMTFDEIMAAVKEFEGKPAVLAEVIGQDAVNALSALTRKQGSTPQKAQGLIEERFAGFGGRAQDDLQQATGIDPDGVSGYVKGERAAREQAAAPLYTGVFDAFQSIESPALKKMAETSDLLKGAMNTAKSRLTNEAAAAGKAPEEMSQLQFWDLVKRKLDDDFIAAKAKEGGAEAARQVEIIRKPVVEMLDSLTGGQYAAARQAGGEGPRLDQAFKLGNKALKTTRTATKDIQAGVNALNPQDVQAARAGMVDDISTRIDQGTLKSQRFRVKDNQGKVKAVMGEEGGGQFLSKMEAEAKLAEIGARWAPRLNSITGTVAENGGPQVAEDVAKIGFAALRGNLREMVYAASGLMRRRGFNQQQMDAMGELLLSNPEAGLRRLGVLPAKGNVGKTAAPTGNALSQSAPQSNPVPATNPVSSAGPVRGAGLTALRGDAGNALAGGVVGGAMPADNNQDRARNIMIGAGGAGLAGRVGPRIGNRLAGTRNPKLKDVNKGRDAYTFDLGETKADVLFDKPEYPNKRLGKLGDSVEVNMEISMNAGESLPLPQVKQLFEKTFAAVEDHAVRYNRPVYNFAGHEIGHDKLYENSMRRLGVPTGYVGVKGKPSGPGGIVTDLEDNFYIVRKDVFEGLPQSIKSQLSVIAKGRDKAASPVRGAGFAGKPPKIKSDIPLGTPPKGKAKLPKSLDEMMAEPVPMQGIAKATGHSSTIGKVNKSAAENMMREGKTAAEVHKKTGLVPLEINGKRILLSVEGGADSADEVIAGFYAARALPRNQQEKWVQELVDEFDPLILDKPLKPKGPVRGAGVLAIGGAGAVAMHDGKNGNTLPPRNEQGQFKKQPDKLRIGAGR